MRIKSWQASVSCLIHLEINFLRPLKYSSPPEVDMVAMMSELPNYILIIVAKFNNISSRARLIRLIWTYQCTNGSPSYPVSNNVHIYLHVLNFFLCFWVCHTRKLPFLAPSKMKCKMYFMLLSIIVCLCIHSGNFNLSSFRMHWKWQLIKTSSQWWQWP